MTIWAVVLAAGAGTRFSSEPGAKLWAPVVGGASVIGRVLDVVSVATRNHSLAGAVVVYDPAHGGRISDLAREAGLRPVPAPNAGAGISESIKAGFSALESVVDQAAHAALVFLADQPTVTSETIRRLVEAAGNQPTSLARPRYREAPEQPGHPVVIGRAHWGLARDCRGDRGFDPVIQARGLTWLEVPVGGANPDIDRPFDLERL